ncbi:MAG: Txe/YoeB family addiction module toxin [Clostridia bacterium]|nr:Txe/YoeB family addiction module toxin [Clostridia bacterium]
MNIFFSKNAWEEYIEWQTIDKKIIKKINDLIKDIQRNGIDNGIGQPEPLKYGFQGCWSRRINQEHRLIYALDENGNLCIIKCHGHYK